MVKKIYQDVCKFFRLLFTFAMTSCDMTNEKGREAVTKCNTTIETGTKSRAKKAFLHFKCFFILSQCPVKPVQVFMTNCLN